MFLSFNWLKELVKIPKNISAQELGLKMTLHTVEIDAVFAQANQFDKIVVGKIKKINPHPNADRLSIAQVDIGERQEAIVCGADNIKVGDLVPVALVGAKLANGLVIKQAKIRGVESAGMLCAEDELGLGPDHSGILILKQKAKPGDSLAKVLSLDDIVFEVDNKSITHRPDLWSHLGMAREIAAFLNSELTEQAKKILSSQPPRIKENEYQPTIKIDDPKLCPRYIAAVVKGIKVEPSPDWLKQRLITAGLRPINNIVDITNYVMLELGQPLHAFDANKLSKTKQINIGVRQAKPKETIQTLDNEVYELNHKELLITADDKPVALAGIMGGAESAVSEQTEVILLESANFNPITIRQASQKIGLRTEASQRFEKGLDPNLAQLALARALNLIIELCPSAYLASQIADQANFSQEPTVVSFSLAWLKQNLGFELEVKKINSFLEKLGFEVKTEAEIFRVKVPSWRPDIKIKQDIAEEVARLYGYNNIEPQMPRVEMKPEPLDKKLDFKRRLRTTLALGARLTEVYNYSFVDEEQLKKLGLDTVNHIRLANPIASHQTLLRQSLAPNMFNNIIKNQARFEEISLFEIGYIYLQAQSQWPKDNQEKEYLPYQEERLGLIFAGSKADQEFERAKQAVNYLARWLKVKDVFLPAEILPAWADKTLSALINLRGEEIGFLAHLQPAIAKRLGIKKQVVFVSLQLEKLFSLAQSQEIKYQPPAKFPAIMRDLALVVNKKVLYNDIKEAILEFSNLIKRAELFDVYKGEKIGKESKSLAFHITYQAQDRTLKSEEIEELQKNLLSDLKQRFGARLRDF